MNSVKLGDVTKYADGRIRCSELTVSNYVGTDNIRQGKAGKDDSQYVPTLGQTTAYKKGDILIANIRPYLQKIWFADNEGGSSADVSTIRVTDDKYSKKFVFYCLFQDEFFDFAMKGAKGSKMPRLDKKQILDFPIVNFDLPVQRSIAKTLSALDKKIALNNKLNTRLEEMARLIYDYWFTQFDFPDAQGKPYKSSGGAMVYNDQLKREIPQGWGDGTIDKIGTVVGGSTPPTKEANNFTNDGIPWITPNDLSRNEGNKFISTGAQSLTEKGVKVASLKIYPAGTVLLSSRAPVGYMAIARNPVTTNQGFKSFIPNMGYSTEYTFYAVKSSLNAIIQYASGSTFKEISGATLKTVKVVVPPVSIANKYSEIVLGLFKQQDICEQENQELAKLRDWLLPMLMTGQVKVVPDA